jgi:hypothetical protein
MSTDIYSKSTDKHQYLSPQSCHPKHCTKSIPYSQALRIKRICSNEQTTKKRLGELKWVNIVGMVKETIEVFFRLGPLHVNVVYETKPGKWLDASINHCFNKASGIDRKDFIQYKEKNANNRVPFVITYHPALSNLSSIVREHWTTIQKHPVLLDNIFCLAVGIAVYDEFFSCMRAAEFLCALDVFARHTSSRITFLTLTIVGRSRGDVSSHQDVYTTNRQINISTCPHRVVILNIAPKVFRTAKLSESNASAPTNKPPKNGLWN